MKLFREILALIVLILALFVLAVLLSFLPPEKEESFIATSECFDFDTLYHASTTESLRFSIPAGSRILFEGDDSFAYKIDSYPSLREGDCQHTSYFFYTNSTSSQARIYFEDDDSERSAELFVTNVFTPRIRLDNKIPRSAMILLEEYIPWSEPRVLDSEDVNGDGLDDYAIQFTYPTLPNRSGIDEEAPGVPQRLVILMSRFNGDYEIGYERRLLCGKCGGVAFGGPPLIDFHFLNSGFRLSQSGGDSWRWTHRGEYVLVNGLFQLRKSVDINFSVYDPDYTETYSERVYDVSIAADDLVEISSREFVAPGDYSGDSSPRLLQLQNYFSFPERFATTTYGFEEYALVPYYESFGGRHTFFSEDFSPNFDGGLRDRAGAFLLHNNQIVWESTVPIMKISMPYSRFIDLTNDGVDELVLFDEKSANGCQYYIYGWNERTLERLTFYPIGASRASSRMCSRDAAIQDIEDDGFYELFWFDIDSKGEVTKQEVYRYKDGRYVRSAEASF